MRFAYLLLLPGLLAAAADPAIGGRLILEDTFASESLNSGWRVAKGKWAQSEGIITAQELDSDKHAAVMRRKVAYKNAAIELHFRLDSAKQVALSLNGAQGHICRVIVKADGMSLVRDADKKAGEKAVVLASWKEEFATGQWHVLYLVVSGSKMKARIGDGAWVEGSHPAIAAQKADIGLPVRGQTASFDLIRIYQLP